LYPGNNAYPSSLADIGFENPQKGDFRLNSHSRYRQSGADFSRLPTDTKK